jgi:hypothetical protein
MTTQKAKRNLENGVLFYEQKFKTITHRWLTEQEFDIIQMELDKLVQKITEK